MREAGWKVVPLTKGRDFDPLIDRSDFPTLIFLKGTLYAITITGNEIFDANEEFSLPLVLDSLHDV